MLAVVPDGGVGKRVAVGLGDGKIRFVQLGQNKVVQELQHDEIEGVVALGFDTEGRMLSGGGKIVKIWEEGLTMGIEAEEEDEEEAVNGSAVRKRGAADSDEDSEDEGDDSSNESEEEEKPKKRKKKRKKGKKQANGVSFSFDGLD